MNIKIKEYIKEIIKFVVLVAIILNVVSYYRSMDLNKNILEEESFKLLDGSIYKVKNDKTIVIHFWATWCPTCEFEASNIDRVSKDYEVITIAVQSGSKKEVQEYLDKHNLGFNVVNDEDGFYANKFNIKAYPTTFIYDKGKNLKFSEVGYTTTAGLISRIKISE